MDKQKIQQIVGKSIEDYTYYYGDYTEVVDKINSVILNKIKKMKIEEIDEKREEKVFSIPKRKKNEKNSKV